MKNIIVSAASTLAFVVIMVIPVRANACFGACYGYAYGYSYSQPSYNFSEGGINYPYGNYHTYYSPSYYVSQSSYNYSYGYPTYYPANQGGYYPYPANPAPSYSEPPATAGSGTNGAVAVSNTWTNRSYPSNPGSYSGQGGTHWR